MLGCVLLLFIALMLKKSRRILPEGHTNTIHPLDPIKCNASVTQLQSTVGVSVSVLRRAEDYIKHGEMLLPSLQAAANKTLL